MHHLIVPYAATSAHLPGQKAPPLAPLPNLTRLLSLLEPGQADPGDEYSLSPPHERACARALGLPTTDGLMPWAAWQAGVAGRACAWFTPCHWRAGMDQVTLQPPEGLDLTETESRALLQALRPWAEEDGIALHFESATRWRAEAEVFADLPGASLDRVAHRRIDAWLPDGARLPQARALLRLQSEAQMLFYSHPINDARGARGLAPINGFWISGSGVWSGQAEEAEKAKPRLADGLRAAALHGHPGIWAQAWTELDQGEIADLLARAERGEAVRLALCGERGALNWASAERAERGLWSRLKGLLGGKRAPDISEILQQL